MTNRRQEPPRIKVQFDDQIFRLQSQGGISRYFVELIDAFASERELGVKGVAPRFTANDLLLASGRARRLPRYVDRSRVRKIANRWDPGGRATHILHHTYYDKAFLQVPSEERPKTVITIFDMIPELFPDIFEENPHFAKHLFVQHADLIICISETTKRDLLLTYGAPAAPVMVTPLAAGRKFVSPLPRDRILRGPYVLFVGQRRSYKDFAILARAFKDASLEKDVRLVAVGGGPFVERERTLLAELEILDRILRIDLDDDGLARAYTHALCFVFPSRYEGFGIPTLEAMASGCPTILAGAPAHIEVGGDAAVYFVPGDVGGLARVLHEVASNAALRETLRAAGRVRATAFTWRETARLTATAYESLLAG